MSANVYLREKNGAAEDAAIVCAIDDIPGRMRFKGIDRRNPYDDNGELVKPGSIVRSMEKWLRLYLGTPGPNGTISAPKIYTDGVSNLGAGVTVYARTTNPGSFSTPGTPSDDTGGTNLFSYTSASPKALDVANAGPFSSTGADFGDYLVLWMTIDSSIVPPGKALEKTLPIEQITIIWTET